MNSWKERCNLVDRKPPKLPKLPTFQGIDDKPPVEETHLTGIYQGSWKLVAFHSQRGPVFRRVMMTLKELCGAHFCGFTPISSDTKGATSASGETRQYRDIGTGLESPKSTWEDHCWRMVMCFDLCDSASFRFKSYELCWSKKNQHWMRVIVGMVWHGMVRLFCCLFVLFSFFLSPTFTCMFCFGWLMIDVSFFAFLMHIAAVGAWWIETFQCGLSSDHNISVILGRGQAHIHSLKLTVRTCQEVIPKNETIFFCNHQFILSVRAVSFGEGIH